VAEPIEVEGPVATGDPFICVLEFPLAADCAGAGSTGNRNLLLEQFGVVLVVLVCEEFLEGRFCSMNPTVFWFFSILALFIWIWRSRSVTVRSNTRNQF